MDLNDLKKNVRNFKYRYAIKLHTYLLGHNKFDGQNGGG